MENAKWLQPLQETADQLQREFVTHQEKQLWQVMSPEIIARVYHPRQKTHQITLHDPEQAVRIVYDTGEEKPERVTRTRADSTLLAALPRASVKSCASRSPRPSVTSSQDKPLPGLGIDPKQLSKSVQATATSTPNDVAALLGITKNERRGSLLTSDIEKPAKTPQCKLADAAVLGAAPPKERKSPLVQSPSPADSDSPSKKSDCTLLGIVTTKDIKKKLSSIGTSDPDGKTFSSTKLAGAPSLIGLSAPKSAKKTSATKLADAPPLVGGNTPKSVKKISSTKLADAPSLVGGNAPKSVKKIASTKLADAPPLVGGNAPKSVKEISPTKLADCPPLGDATKKSAKKKSSLISLVAKFGSKTSLRLRKSKERVAVPR